MRAPDDLDALCRRLYPQLVGTLTAYWGDVHVAEELSQEALARTCANWDEVRDMASPEAWVHRVAINAANSRWRRLQASRRAREHLKHEAVDTALERDVAGDVALREAVAELPRRQRIAVVLRYVADLSSAEAADVLGTTPQAVRNLTHRAAETLRDQLLVESSSSREADHAN